MKLSPSIKLGCSKCKQSKLNLDIDTSKFNVQMPDTKVTTIFNRKDRFKDNKVTSLF